ncbi:MAG: hypothetical protein WCI64_11540 [Chlorobium sp.]
MPSFRLDWTRYELSSLLQQQPSIERHDCNSYSVMLKLFCYVKREDEDTAQTELVVSLRVAET